MLVRANQLIKGDHAGSEAKAGVMIRDSLKPLRSLVHSCGPPLAPGVSRKNISMRPFGAHVGPSLWEPSVRIFSPEPSGLMTPIANRPLLRRVNAIRLPLGDHTGVE